MGRLPEIVASGTGSAAPKPLPPGGKGSSVVPVPQTSRGLKKDDKLLEKFNKNPAAVIEEYAGIDLPDDQVNQLVEGIKAKIKLDKIGDTLGGLTGLFGKK